MGRQTIAVIDLVTGVQLGPWWHEARVDWLELTESGHLLLFRHTRRRLALLRIDTGEKEIIASGVSFVQWIENSDAVVAQTPTHLLIWCSVWEPQCVVMSECVSVSAVSVSERRVLLEGGQIQAIVLDEHRLAFNSALRSGDLKDCAQYLDAVSRSADVGSFWCQLAEQALTGYDVELATKCYKAVGDEARTFYLEKTFELASTKGDGNIDEGLKSPEVRARLAIFVGGLTTAEEYYVRGAAQPELAINMYKQFNRWADAIALAEKVDRQAVTSLRQQYMDYLTSTGAKIITEEWWERAGEISERKGDIRTAVDYYSRGNNYARAVQLAREACPEGEWGAWLVTSRQAGAAVPHLIEAARTVDALTAALKAHHYKKALQIVQVLLIITGY
ncbi:unnamed protein product [Danaus chrysippus]|uniref:(African queen) hypothetical protein n=1 Tax=Danaus chrysippus TaxID=151541 RepID=A0A8J2QFQ1_9NEOP|nr:unnamed protein product [Danaus chrysippus]